MFCWELDSKCGKPRTLEHSGKIIKSTQLHSHYKIHHVSKLIHGQSIAKLVGIAVVLFNVLLIGQPSNVLL